MMIRVALAGLALALGAGCGESPGSASAQERPAEMTPQSPTCAPPPSGRDAEAGPSGQWLVDTGGKARLADADNLPDDPKAIRLFIDFDGSVYLGQTVVGNAELQAALSKHARERPETPVLVDWHRLAKRGFVSDAVSIINAAGVEPMLIEKPDTPPARRVIIGLNGKPLAAATRPAPDAQAMSLWMESVYPPAAIREGREGDSTVSMCIGPDGMARNVRLVESSGSADLDNAIVNGLGSVRFHPACDANEEPVDWCEPPYKLTIAWRTE